MSYAVTNPATGETVKTYPTITDAELDAAIASADEAHRTWSKSSTVEERAALIRRVGELHIERRQELAEIIVREMGKPIEQALGEVDFAADDLRVLRRPRGRVPEGRAGRRCSRARARRSSAARRSACSSASCRGTSRTTRSPASPARTSSSATRSC